MLICATQRTASKKLLEVSREWLSSPAMNGLMQEVRENSGLAFEVSYKNSQAVRIEAYGKGAAVRGLSWGAKRPDLVIIDDPQDEEDARSETVTASDWDWFLSDVYFLGQGSRIFIIGNNLGERCIMECIMRNAERLKFEVSKVPILTQGGQSTWPSKWPMKEIEAGKSGADYGDVDLLSGSALAGGTCGNHCVRHGIPPVCFVLPSGYQPQAELVITVGAILGSFSRRHRCRVNVAGTTCPAMHNGRDNPG